MDGVCYELDNDADTLTITYTGKIYDFFLKSKSPYLINKYGEKKVQNAQRASGILAALSFVVYLLFLCFVLLINGTLIKYFWIIAITSVGGIIVFLYIESQLRQVNELYKDSKCKKCGKDFAYNEFQEPLIKEVSTHDKYKITMTRYWRCKYCGDDNPVGESLYYRQSKGKINSREVRVCKICENRDSMREYRTPDIKEKNDDEITIRHYKCSHCGYYEITIKEKSLGPD